MNIDAGISHKNKGIQVISRAADILRILGEDKGGLSLGQIARRANLPRSTVQRIVAALATEGFVSTENGSGGIKLGPEIQSLAQAAASETKDQLRPIMHAIAKETGETVDLAILEAGQMLFIDQVVGSQRLRTVSSIGERFPLTTTANGKAALGRLEEAEAAKLVLAEIETTQGTRPDLPSILLEIANIRRGKLAADEDEHTEGVSALGFAVRDRNGDIYAISIPVPSSRFGRLKATLEASLSIYQKRAAKLISPAPEA